MIWAVVPAKLGKNAKERLAPILRPEQREQLARGMLTDVLAGLGQCPEIAGTIVVSQDEAALALARAAGATPCVEEGPGGLNRSVEQGVQRALREGASAAVLVMGDLPLLTAHAVSSAIARTPKSGVVLIPSSDGTGTNLVVTRPPDLLRPRFGPQSLAKHLDQLRSLGTEYVTQQSTGIALDVDTPEDLTRLREVVAAGSATARALDTARRDPAASVA